MEEKKLEVQEDGEVCQYCQSKEDVTTHFAADETAFICESCFEGMYA